MKGPDREDFRLPPPGPGSKNGPGAFKSSSTAPYYSSICSFQYSVTSPPVQVRKYNLMESTFRPSIRASSISSEWTVRNNGLSTLSPLEIAKQFQEPFTRETLYCTVAFDLPSEAFQNSTATWQTRSGYESRNRTCSALSTSEWSRGGWHFATQSS